MDGERKTVTALFADIKGSTELMEDLDPEAARAIIDPALTLMMDAVHRYEPPIATTRMFASSRRSSDSFSSTRSSRTSMSERSTAGLLASVCFILRAAGLCRERFFFIHNLSASEIQSLSPSLLRRWTHFWLNLSFQVAVYCVWTIENALDGRHELNHAGEFVVGSCFH
jgi:hypothetical protein